MTRDLSTAPVLPAGALADWEGTKRSVALHGDGRHDMHLHALVRDDVGRYGTPSATAPS